MKFFLKQKLKNKFILIVSIIIIAILTFQYFSKPKIDTNTYVVLIKWETFINGSLLKKENKEQLKVWDIITTKQDSACVIEWWDWSLTRLWENWKIEIEELKIKNDLTQINLQFKLVNWKTWSNVVSFLWWKSYFKQNFEDVEAAVRWTIFDVNLEKDYVYVTNHEIILENKKENKTTIVPQNKAFSISTFSFIEMEKFLKEIVDKKWLKINNRLDNQFFNKLKTKLSKDLGNIDKILDKNKTYEELLEKYQKFNFVKINSPELFKAKYKLKKQLIDLAPTEEKKELIKYSIYDLKDSLELNNINEKTKKTIENLKNIIWKNTDSLQNILWENYNKFENIIKDFDSKELIEKANKLRDNAINEIWNLFKK